MSLTKFHRATVAPLVPPERLQFLAARIHELGPRPLYELCRELERGAELHPALKNTLGFPPISFARMAAIACLSLGFLQEATSEAVATPARLCSPKHRRRVGPNPEPRRVMRGDKRQKQRSINHERA